MQILIIYFEIGLSNGKLVGKRSQVQHYYKFMLIKMQIKNNKN